MMIIPKPDNLKIWVPCDGENVNRANGATFTITGSPSTVQGKHGLATTFDSTSKYINLGNVSSLINTGSGDWTYAAWVKRNTTTQQSGGSQFIFSRDLSGSREINFYLDNNDNGRIIIFYFNSTGSGIYAAESGKSISDNTTWHHVVTTKSGSTPKIYVDAVSQTLSLGGSAWTESKASYAQNSYIGRFQYNTAQLTNTNIQHFMMWNVALSAQEIYKLYKSQKGIVCG